MYVSDIRLSAFRFRTLLCIILSCMSHGRGVGYSIKKRSSTVAAANKSVHEFISNLRNYCPSHVALGNLGMCHSLRHPSRARSSWLVVPYHPLWGKSGLPGRLKAMSRFWQSSLKKSGEDIEDLRVSVAWKNGGRSLKSRISSFNRI